MRRLAAVCAAAAGLAFAGNAEASVVSFMPNVALTSTPFAISFGDGSSQYAFTADSTGNGPGAAVATIGTGMASNFGGLTDFSLDATIDQTGELYGFAAFPTATTIPSSAADDFIGLAFTLADGLHYGYAEVAGPALVSYAFDSVPDTGIVTGAVTAVPEPASLALLLAGVVGVVSISRRRRVQDGLA